MGVSNRSPNPSKSPAVARPLPPFNSGREVSYARGVLFATAYPTDRGSEDSYPRAVI